MTAASSDPKLTAQLQGDTAGGLAMKWKTPRIVEIAVGLEINAYACAETK